MSGAGTYFRTTLNEITLDKAKITSDQIPSYYDKTKWVLFYRLSMFEPVEREWLIANSVMDSDPEPGSTEKAIKGQANPAHLRLFGKAWIFQGNPEYFDSRAAVKSLEQISWLANQHATAMGKGDRVYLWESGPSAGVIAVAEILDTVTDGRGR